MGLSLGIGGVLTFKNARKLVEVVEYAPLESLLLETDSPYLAPVPNRGKRNSSLNIPYVVEKIAEIKGVSREEVEEITWKNSFRVFFKSEIKRITKADTEWLKVFRYPFFCCQAYDKRSGGPFWFHRAAAGFGY